MSSTQIPVISTMNSDKFPPNWSDSFLPLLHLSPSTTPPILSYFLCGRLLLACNCLNPDRHCPSVVMATIWRSLTVANWCPTYNFHLALLPFRSVKSLCWVCRSPCATFFVLMFSQWCCTSGMRTGSSLRWQKSMPNEPWRFFLCLFGVNFLLQLVSLSPLKKAPAT